MFNNRYYGPAMLVGCLLGSSAHADSMRCGLKLVGIGDIKAEVVQKCGQPIATDSYCRNEYRMGKYGQEAICHNVELWTFNFGQGTFLMNVEFEEGRITTITHGDRVE